MIRRIVRNLGKAQANVTNKIIDELNVKRKEQKRALLMHAEVSAPSLKSILTRGFALNPNRAGHSSEYVTKVAKSMFGKQYELAPEWKLASKNKLVVDSHFDINNHRGEIGPSQLRSLIKRGILKPGMLLGIFYPENRRKNVPRKVTHILIYIGEETFWHNYGGINKISLTQVYNEKEEGKRVFYPVQVIDAKETIAK